MALWNPREVDSIGSAEHLGRRRFKRPQLMGVTGQKPLPGLDPLEFLEKRDRHVSVDRLGKTGVDRKVLTHLRPLAELQAEKLKPKQQFLGWAIIQAGKFLREAGKLGYSITPAPVVGTESEDNEYHAHISYPDGLEPIYAALYLREMFDKHGSTSEIPQNRRRGTLSSILERLYLRFTGVKET